MGELFDNPTAVVVVISGKSQPTVSKFFKEVSIRHSSWLSIYEACLELVEQQEKKLSDLVERQNKLLKIDDSTTNTKQ